MPKKDHKKDAQDNSAEASIIDNDILDIPSANFDDAMGASPAETRTASSADSESTQQLQQKIEALASELAKANAKADENWERLLRKEAEYQNLVRRSQEERIKSEAAAVGRFAEGLLDVIDGLEQGIACCDNPDASVKDIFQGLQLSHKAFLDCLEKFNIKPIDPMGEAFNPAYHEALTTQESNDVAPNKVLAVVQKGYSLRDRLLRPARVIVAKAAQQSASSEKK